MVGTEKVVLDEGESVSNWSRHTRGFFVSRISVLTDCLRTVDGMPVDRSDWICLIGRENYLESRKTYPRIAEDELARIVALELSADRGATVFWCFGRETEQHREVLFFTVHAAVSLPSEALLWVPETLLAAKLLGPSQLGVLRRNDREFFFADGSPGAARAGLMQTADLYAMGVGRDFQGDPLIIEGFLKFDQIVAGLKAQPARAWAGFVNRPFWRRFGESTALAGAACLSVGFLYLLLSSGYLWAHARFVESRLAEISPKVSELITAQRQLGELEGQVTEITRELSARQLTFDHWRLIKLMVDQGAAISYLQYVDSTLTIRGLATSATQILGIVSKAEGVHGARFSSPVRQSGEREEFAIEVSIKGVANEGRK